MAENQRLDVSVVLPTFNESASLTALIPEIANTLQQAGLRGEVVVVDDSSPDGTAAVAEGFSERYAVRVIRRTGERGLATAVLTGFGSSEAEVCVVMDADGSHPTSALPGMVRMVLEDKAEIVVGSRHVPGGGSKDWPLFSQLKSRFAASLAFGLSGMSDPTTGFMAIRRSLVDRLELDPVGWKIVLEAVVKAHPARLAEVPIVFSDREHGESKQSLAVLGQYLTHLYKLYRFRFPTFIELLKFCLVGAVGLLVDLSIVTLLKAFFELDTRLCQVFGFAAAVSFNYAINRRYSFERARETPVFASYVAYVGANLIGLLFRMLTVHTLILVTDLDQGRGYLLLSVLGIALATLINFVGVKYFAFTPTQPRAHDEPPQRTSTPRSLGPSPRQLGLVLAAVAFAFVSANLWSPGPRTHDEGVNVIMAHNIRASFSGLVHPSVTPGIAEDWQRDALPELGNTPVYPLLLALALQAGSLGATLLSLLVFALAVRGVHGVLAPESPSAARAATLMFATSPALFSAFSTWEFEPIVSGLCISSLALLVRGRDSKQEGWAFASGLCLGLAFAVKTWLVLPGVLALIGYVTAQARNAEPGSFSSLRTLKAACFGLCATGLSHLAFVAITAPHDLLPWLQSVYLGVFSGRGVSGPKLSGTSGSVFAYLGWMLRDHGHLLPILALGLPALTRRPVRQERAWLGAIGFALLALVPLSVPSAKEPLYMLPVVPFVYLLAGLCLVAPDHTPARYVSVNRSAARVALFFAGCLGLGWLSFGLWSGAVGGLVVALSLAHLVVWTVPAVRTLRARPVQPVIVPCTLTSIALAALLMTATDWLGAG